MNCKTQTVVLKWFPLFAGDFSNDSFKKDVQYGRTTPFSVRMTILDINEFKRCTWKISYLLLFN